MVLTRNRAPMETSISCLLGHFDLSAKHAKPRSGAFKIGDLRSENVAAAVHLDDVRPPLDPRLW